MGLKQKGDVVYARGQMAFDDFRGVLCRDGYDSWCRGGKYIERIP